MQQSRNVVALFQTANEANYLVMSIRTRWPLFRKPIYYDIAYHQVDCQPLWCVLILVPNEIPDATFDNIKAFVDGYTSH